MSKGLEALEKVEDFFIDYGSFDETGEYKNYISLYQTPEYQVIRKELKALEIIVKKANIRLFETNGRYYFKTTNNLYEISKEKYDLLKEVLL